MLKRFLKIIKRNVIPFVIGAVVFGSIGVIIADTISSNNVTYTENNQTTVKGAIDDLYSKASRLDSLVDLKSINVNGTGGAITIKYWNNNFAGSSYTFASNSIPTGSGLRGTYDSRAALASAYSSFASTPIYIKTTQINGTTCGHTACLWYNDHEFCITPNYWTGTIGTQNATVAENTKNKLKADMETALGTTASSCYSSANYAYCYFGLFYCNAYFDGHVFCYSGSRTCRVLSDGSAFCY